MPFSDPKFPVINPSPDVDECIKSMRYRDYFMVASITGASWCYGYVFGKPVRRPTASTAAALGLTFASFLIIQDTRNRLMGYQENSRELKKYGPYPIQPPQFNKPATEQETRYPTATGLTSESTKPKLNWKNYS
eukprot:CAMPEP_0202445966 /NCGR_PEP_ID=MMETSP1360-20130828/4651_1 /ASSEMBLY_ACC=CAM_ASM_000848 /TAXON_ID=515479 /ORGANISM="Licmophora paradoxa, Strain CCMP2313" /LENGTH=133 /DNA_ID=CAMNT_0049062379 /DNA_START=102 /DNA_END=503 /DNA_ORIENTATION=-